jgi:hypothetical protein
LEGGLLSHLASVAVTPATTAAATAAATTALTTAEILRASGLGPGALRFGWSRALRTLLLTPGRPIRTALLALGGTLRTLLATLALIAPAARTIAPLPGPAASGRSRLTIAAATPRSAAAPFVRVREGGASGAPHHPHPVGPRSNAEEPARTLFENGDHHFGAGETQRFQALRHRRIQRPAFENVTLVGHRSPQSCASRPGGKANPGMPALALQANLESWGEPRPTDPWPAGVSSRGLAGALARCP